MPELTDVCKICTNSYQWHLDNKPKHAFVGEGDQDTSLRFEAPAKADLLPQPKRDPDDVRSALSQSADPVVRALLVFKGLITAEELTEFTARMAEGLASSGAMVFGVGHVEEGSSRSVDGDSGGGQPERDRAGDPAAGNGQDPV